MNVFDIIGPIMIGPSSSHTAGAAKIGYIIRELMGEPIVKANIKLHGSFAATYKGHGTDKALIAGLLGMHPDDERIKNSKEIAEKEGMEVSISKVKLENAHPNTTVIKAVGKSKKTLTVQGTSIGGGEIEINEINGMKVNFNGENNTLVIFHMDAPGEISSVSDLIAKENINIAGMKVFRNRQGGNAVMIIETDQSIDKKLLVEIGMIKNIDSVSAIAKMEQ